MRRLQLTSPPPTLWNSCFRIASTSYLRNDSVSELSSFHRQCSSMAQINEERNSLVLLGIGHLLIFILALLTPSLNAILRSFVYFTRNLVVWNFSCVIL